MWKCTKCNEKSEDISDCCWSCGTNRDGSSPAEPLPEQGGVVSEAFPLPSSAPRPPKGGKHSFMSRDERPMHSGLISLIRARLVEKPIDELLTIWIENDRTTWSDDAFEAILQILTEKGVSIPSQGPAVEPPPAEPLPEQSGVASEAPPLPPSAPRPPLIARESLDAHGLPSSASRLRESGNPVIWRYNDAYLIARTITAFGAVVKVIAFGIGGAILLIFFLLACSWGGAFGVGGIVVGAIVGIAIYVLGIRVAAQGQILKATLDTAVNTSPLLTKDEMRQIMSLG